MKLGLFDRLVKAFSWMAPKKRMICMMNKSWWNLTTTLVSSHRIQMLNQDGQSQGSPSGAKLLGNTIIRPRGRRRRR
jgi:hypothetical protein